MDEIPDGVRTLVIVCLSPCAVAVFVVLFVGLLDLIKPKGPPKI